MIRVTRSEIRTSESIDYGPLIACRHVSLQPKQAIPREHLRNTEILVFVEAGELTFQQGNMDPVGMPSGWCALLSTGTGMAHDWKNDGTEPVDAIFIQMQAHIRGAPPAVSFYHPSPHPSGATPLVGASLPGPTWFSEAAVWLIWLEKRATLPIDEVSETAGWEEIGTIQWYFYLLHGEIVIDENTLSSGDEARWQGMLSQPAHAHQGARGILLAWPAE